MKFINNKYITAIVYFIFTVFSAVSFLALNNLQYVEWLYYVGWFIIIHFFISMYCLYQVKIIFFSLSGFFVTFSYLFHLGQVVIRAISPTYNFIIVDYASWLDNDLFKKATIFSLLTISFVVMGMILLTYMDSTDRKTFYKETNMNYKLMSWIILATTLPFRLFIDVKAMNVALQNGYLAVFEMDISGVAYQMASFYIIGIMLLLATYRKSIIKARAILSITLIYNVITMISGGRSRQIILILIILYLYFRIVEKLTLKYFVLILITGLIGLMLLNAITALRTDGIDSFRQLIQTTIMADSNPILTAMEEFGSSIYTVYQTIFAVPDIQDYSYGSTYIYSFAPVLLNINGILTDIVDKATFAKNIKATAPLGGSYIGELYYNFGYFSYLFAIVVGGGVQLVSLKIEEHIKNNNYYRLSFYIMTFYNAVWWVRASFVDFTRAFVWGTIMLLIINKVIISYSQKNEKKSI